MGAEVFDLRQDVDATFTELDPITSSVSVFVSQAGSDTTGTGTLSNPYATIGRALQDCPQTMGGAAVAFRVRVIPPYTGGGFVYEMTVPTIHGTGTAITTNSVTVEAYIDEDNVGPDDPRFTVLQGPLTSIVAGTYNGSHATYTVDAGVVAQSRIGSIARIFRNGVEVGRGILADIEPGATDKLFIVQTRSTLLWTPTAGDEIYLCDYTVVLTTGVRICTGNRTPFFLAGLRITNSVQVLHGEVRLCGVQLIGSSTAAVLYVYHGGQCTAFSSTVALPFLPGNEQALTNMTSAYVTNSPGASSISIEGINGCYIGLYGAVIDHAVRVGFGTLVLGSWHRGSIWLYSGGTIYTATGPTNRSVFAGKRDVPWNGPAIFLSGGNMGVLGTGTVTLGYLPAGYTAGQHFLRSQRSHVVSPIRVMGVGGPAALTVPVFNAASFSEIVVVAGDITGPAGQDVIAGTTAAAFAGMPVVDAATLTRIATS